jgi:SRSO17 transposase
MKETTPAAMPPCFDRWCQKFDDIFGHLAQKREFRNYLGGLLGESERKNLSQMAENALASNLPQITSFFNGSALVIQ